MEDGGPVAIVGRDFLWMVILSWRVTLFVIRTVIFFFFLPQRRHTITVCEKNFVKNLFLTVNRVVTKESVGIFVVYRNNK